MIEAAGVQEAAEAAVEEAVPIGVRTPECARTKAGRALPSDLHPAPGKSGDVEHATRRHPEVEAASRGEGECFVIRPGIGQQDAPHARDLPQVTDQASQEGRLRQPAHRRVRPPSASRAKASGGAPFASMRRTIKAVRRASVLVSAR
jgi:hypothetical protein